MTETEITELETCEEWAEAFPVMRQLRTHLDEASYLDYLREMTADGYRLFARTVGGDVVALAGIGEAVNMYHGRHVWVYELVTDEDHRSEGHGAALLSFVEEWAADRDRDVVALSSGTQRTDAHRFYEERARMDRASYVYTKSLE